VADLLLSQRCRHLLQQTTRLQSVLVVLEATDQVLYFQQLPQLVVVSLEIAPPLDRLVVLVVVVVDTKAQEAVLLTKVLLVVLLLTVLSEDKVEVEQVQLAVSQPQAEQTSFLVALVGLEFQATLQVLL
jgi:hypothetical protein